MGKIAETREWENHHALNILSLININCCLYSLLAIFSVYNTESIFIKLHLAMILFSCDMNRNTAEVTVWLFSQKDASHEALKF